MTDTPSRRVTRSRTGQADDSAPTPRRGSRARSNTREVTPKPRQRRRAAKAVDDDDEEDISVQGSHEKADNESVEKDDGTAEVIRAAADVITHSSQPQTQLETPTVSSSFIASAKSSWLTWIVPVLAFAFIVSVGTAGTIYMNAPHLRYLYQTYTQPAPTADELLTRIRALPSMQHEEDVWSTYYTTLQAPLINHFHQAHPPPQPLVITIGAINKHHNSVKGFVKDLATNIAYQICDIRAPIADATLRRELEACLNASSSSLVHISNLDKMSIGALSILQQYTDDTDAPYKRALYIISLTLPNLPETAEGCIDVIDKRLDAMWKAMDESKKRALKSRLRRHPICI